jgi:NAD(P)-dependent dehydrogenase (short-subunit alcohol dehydrogenase family)
MENPTERTILITGATDGLGRRVAEDLAGTGATLLLHGRDRDKGMTLLEELRNVTGNQKLYYYNADLASLSEVRRLTEKVSFNWQRLDVLVNNAGLGAGPDPQKRETSVDSFELRLAVNYLAPFLLTRMLLPLLYFAAEKEGDTRIVNVASAAQRAIDFADPMLLADYDGMRAYSQSKLALVMFSFDLAGELAQSGITVNALHPVSLMDTKMVREWFGPPRTSVEQGATALKRLVCDKALADVTGAYFDGLQQARAEDQAYDEKARRRLREMSERWVGL